MSLDDFIDSSHGSATSGLASSSPEAGKPDSTSTNAISSAIPINKSRKNEVAAQSQFNPQSVPAAAQRGRMDNEFGYLKRHHRKTSIDDRKVSFLPTAPGEPQQPAPPVQHLPAWRLHSRPMIAKI